MSHRVPTQSISFPEALPVSARREEIARAIAAHQVVIVCGETGSGKTTQLPKICLQLGRGQKKLIGHTQPRRIAARATATRVAQELQSELGQWVGYKIRFNEKVGPNICVKLMTDGILLAETQGDPLLSAYDTLIIDEAHERSLNIDFLLGYLKTLTEKRSDLKLIITSATIDADRFARHFALGDTPAPVIEVSGRLYPVEMRYRPLFEPESDNKLKKPGAREEFDDALTDALDECTREGPGDVLVFLPGEREIREAAEVLRGHAARSRAHIDILPLYARLTAAEQERVFKVSGNARRVVLATNVAETSLTVPGIRFVIDSGLARVKRYSYRNKVEQLQIEKISQASARQRAGRCGRVASGVCIRLYDEDDFNARPAFTDPEILRSSLAAVILRMKALKLDEIGRFPFLEPPPPKAIADGYQLLQELGAVDEDHALTKLGEELARLPLDPRIARMILGGRDQHALTEVLIIAAALSLQDPRDRPSDKAEAADRAQARFDDPRSEFLAYLKLWQFYGEQKTALSQRKLASLCREHFLSPNRMREWVDIHSQLAQLCEEHHWRGNTKEASFEQIHRALLTGLIGNVAMKNEGEQSYLGARGIRIFIHPGSTLFKKGGRWIMAAELIDTTRLYARTLANIEPAWVEAAAQHLLKRSHYEPRWEKKAGQAVVWERGVLYGLPVYQQRRVDYGRIDPKHARELMIREGLVIGHLETRASFFAHNQRLRREIEDLEHKSRRPDVLVDDELIVAFYDHKLPEDVINLRGLDAWRTQAEAREPKVLYLKREDLMRHDAGGITTDLFPKQIRLSASPVEFALGYHFEPGNVRDGVTASIPLASLNQVNATRAEWLVPGIRREKVLALLKSLPQKLRRGCVPLPDFAARFCDEVSPTDTPLAHALGRYIRVETGVEIPPDAFKLETLPNHLLMNFRVVDEHGRQIDMSRNLSALKAEHAADVAQSFGRLNKDSADEDDGRVLHARRTDWDFGTLDEVVEVGALIGYPAVQDECTHVDVTLFDDAAVAQEAHAQGILRLMRLQLSEPIKHLEKNIGARALALLYSSFGSEADLAAQMIEASLARAALNPPLPRDQAAFITRKQEVRTRLNLIAGEISALIKRVLDEHQAAQKKLGGIKSGFPNAAAEMEAQVKALLPKNFITATPYARLTHVPRYLKAVQLRIDKLRLDAPRDARLVAEMSPVARFFDKQAQAQYKIAGGLDERMQELRWMLEELRVSLFAQELKTPVPISVKRVQKFCEAWTRL